MKKGFTILLRLLLLSAAAFNSLNEILLQDKEGRCGKKGHRDNLHPYSSLQVHVTLTRLMHVITNKIKAGWPIHHMYNDKHP